VKELVSKTLSQLVRLRPRDDTLYVSQNHTVLATGRDGFVNQLSEHGLFVYETRVLSRYFYLIEGQRPQPVALSNVQQHSWLGYYIVLPPGNQGREGDEGNPAQHTVELRLSRFIGDGMHEDIDLTNFTQEKVAFTLELNIDADFADLSDLGNKREQTGIVKSDWRKMEGATELIFDYEAYHSYDHQGEIGTAHIHRAVTLRIENATTVPQANS